MGAPGDIVECGLHVLLVGDCHHQSSQVVICLVRLVAELLKASEQAVDLCKKRASKSARPPTTLSPSAFISTRASSELWCVLQEILQGL